MSHPSRLELGDHPVADVLRDLEISADGVMSRDYRQMQLILPAAVKLAVPATRAVDYVGRNVAHGRFTITYEPGATVDLYAPPREVPFGEGATLPEAEPFVTAESPEGLGPEARV